MPGEFADAEIVRHGATSPSACLCSRSVGFCGGPNQVNDLDFILEHVDDLREVFQVGTERKTIRPAARAHGRARMTVRPGAGRRVLSP
jgi:hypothetical protein